MPTRAMVLTLGETLFPAEQYRDALCQHVANDLAGRLRLDAEGLFWALREVGGPRIDEEPQRFLAEFVRQERLPEAEVSRLYQTICEHDPEGLQLYPSARKFLEHARGKWQLALIVHGHGVVQRRKIRALGLVDQFDFVVCLADHGEIWQNSAHLPYLAILRRFALRPANVLAVSCNARRDFPGPRGIGIPCARVRHPGRALTGAGELLIDVDSLLEIFEQPVVMASGQCSVSELIGR
ncbi:MAG: HAD family hydrolase [Planctomycetota bacterium]